MTTDLQSGKEFSVQNLRLYYKTMPK